MALDHFMVFAAVAKHRNVTKAAQDLHISQPAVSKHLRFLERNYNAKLYNIEGRGIELTSAGRVFLRNAKTILKQHEKLKQRLHAVSSENKVDTLTVGGTYSPCVFLLPSLLALFKKSHPHTHVSLRTEIKTLLQEMVKNSEVDMAIVNNPLPSRSLRREPFRDEPLTAFVSRGHPLASKKRLTLRDFARTPLVVRARKETGSTAEKVRKHLKERGFDFKTAMRCQTPEAVKTAVRRKLGIGVLFEESIGPDIRKGEFKRINIPGFHLRGRSAVVYHKYRPLSASAQDFLDLLRRHRRNLGKL